MSKAEKNRGQIAVDRGEVLGKDAIYLNGREERSYGLSLRRRIEAGESFENAREQALIEVTSAVSGLKSEQSTDGSPL